MVSLCLCLLPRAEAAEHDLVLKQLEPMDKGRRCYRMIGDVLVERTVAETLPAGRLRGGKCAHTWGERQWLRS
jgi:hypothetical protein